jgi:hypothetical protein
MAAYNPQREIPAKIGNYHASSNFILSIFPVPYFLSM